MPMPCIEELNYDILMGNSSYEECADYIISNFKEIYYVSPGYRLFDLHLIGIPPVPLGVDGENIIIPYLKPCKGCFVLKLEGKNELPALKNAKKEVIKFDGTNYAVACWQGNICEKCPRKKVFFEGCRLVQCLKKPELSFKLIQIAVRFLETFSNHRRV